MPKNLLDYTTANLEILEWEDLKNIFRSFCIFPNLTSNRVFGHSHDLPKIQSSFFHTRHILGLFDTNDYYDFIEGLKAAYLSEVIFKDYHLIPKNKFFDLPEINSFVLVLEFILTNFKYIETNFVNFDFSTVQTRELRKFINEFRMIMSADGEINYLGHPELARIHNSTQELERGIREKLNRLLNNEFADVIQFNNYDIINDHFVVPVRSDRFNNSIGEIISRSETGNTLYVQPFSIKEEVYRRLQLLVEMQNILYRINLGFNQALQHHFNTLELSLQFLQYLDEYNAKASFAFNLNLSEPIFVDSNRDFSLEGLFHPLIPNCVRNTIAFDGKSLIISGPNTGGKTVTLKSVTICAMLAHLGLYTPTTSAQLPYFEAIFFLANDNQDLSEGLSSFSAEIKEFTDLLTNLKDSSLILIDEIFNSTASDEASTLAISLFEHILNQSSSTILVSTHHELLKKVLQKNQLFQSCHVGFDFEKNAPTYRLHFGVPGSSLAHNIFKKLFKPIELAKKLHEYSLTMLDTNKVKYNELLEELNQKQTFLDKQISEYSLKHKELDNRRKAFEGELHLKRQKLESELKDKTDKLINKVESILNEVKSGQFQSKKSVEKSLHDVRLQLPSRDNNPKKDDYRNYTNPTDYIIGEKYFSTFIGNEVVLKAINNGVATVAKGNFTLKCPLTSLKNPMHKQKEKVVVSFLNTPDVAIEHDCRGMRLEEFSTLIENLIPNLLSKNIPYLSIIHGHGDGILKKWLRKYAKQHPEIDWEQGANGNDGETKLITR